MDVSRVEEPEGSLLNIIYDIGPLEWRKFQRRYPQVWVGDHFETVNRSEFPPYISFRFLTENEEVINRLRQAIESYSGKVSWVLDEHRRIALPGTNWIVRPSRIWEVKDKAAEKGVVPELYIAQNEPEFGPVAYDDLEGLADHIRKIFFD